MFQKSNDGHFWEETTQRMFHRILYAFLCHKFILIFHVHMFFIHMFVDFLR